MTLSIPDGLIMWFIVLAVCGVMIDDVNYNEIIALHKYLVDNLLSLFIINFRYKIHYCLSFWYLIFALILLFQKADLSVIVSLHKIVAALRT